MQNPSEEVSSVILQLATTTSPDVQQAAVYKYMTPDVSFEHPVCSVRSSANSREKLLKIYQWYRVLSPHIDLKVESVVLDRENEVMYIEMIQWFKLFFLPINPQPARLVTRLQLRKVLGLYYISRQEDFYHTVDFVRLLLPPLAPIFYILLTFGAIFSFMGSVVAQQLGFWTPRSGEKGIDGEGGHDGDIKLGANGRDPYPGDHTELYD
ncbi:hypothetical protein MD484_g1532, partial [Candolleomyces efflorescens]